MKRKSENRDSSKRSKMCFKAEDSDSSSVYSELEEEETSESSESDSEDGCQEPRENDTSGKGKAHHGSNGNKAKSSRQKPQTSDYDEDYCQEAKESRVADKGNALCKSHSSKSGSSKRKRDEYGSSKRAKMRFEAEDSDASSVYSELEDEESESDSEDGCHEARENDDTGGEGKAHCGSNENKTIPSGQKPQTSDGNEDDCQEGKENGVADKGKAISKSDGSKSGSRKQDEYEYDSSDEEDLRNTVGNIPMHWYDEYLHIGYDLDGKPILKPSGNDEIEEFLNKLDDVNYWRTVKDKMTGQKVVLSDEDIDIIQKIQGGKYPDSANRYEPFEDFFTYKTMIHPVSNRPEHKRSFVPSKIEKQKVAKLVYAIKMGWLKPRVRKDTTPKYYLLWDQDTPDASKRLQHYIPAPKLKLPGHEESYNPPPEYLFTKEEEEVWMSQEPEERKLDFIPRKFSCMRDVPAYLQFIGERFERCLDLYLCPRQRKMRVNVDPNDLIPKLPKPRDLQPFPSVQAAVYVGHTSMVRCIDVEPTGEFLASGSDDGTVKVWEVQSGRCLRSFNFYGVIKSIAWCPCKIQCLLLVASDSRVSLVSPNVGCEDAVRCTNAMLTGIPDNLQQNVVQWSLTYDEHLACGTCIIIDHPKEVTKVIWHARGDYFASLMPDAGSKAIVIHQLSQYRSQMPFQKFKDPVQSILFHPLRPLFFVATQRYIRVYNLLKQELAKKLMANCKWVSCCAVHPQGDNLIVGSYDCRLSWFDLDLSNKPYKTLRHHKKAIRQVAFHKRYPLFASASDDSVIICHGQVYSDLLQNPLIVPVKVLRGHSAAHGLNVLDCCFHPTLPWIFTSGADSTIRLFW